MIWTQLFLSFLLIGMGAFGGGMATLPLLFEEFVTHRQWLSPSELNQIITISEMTPGPIAINAATFIGFRVAGVGGSLVATIAVLLPSLSMLTLFYWVVFRHQSETDGHPRIERITTALRPGISAMIAYALWQFGSNAIIDLPTAALAVGVFVLLTATDKCHPILLLVGAGTVGILIYW